MASSPVKLNCSMSPSSRRAWIEILAGKHLRFEGCVALLAEGVDRNMRVLLLRSLGRVALLAEGVDRNSPPDWLKTETAGRPPRGGRG